MLKHAKGSNQKNLSRMRMRSIAEDSQSMTYEKFSIGDSEDENAEYTLRFTDDGQRKKKAIVGCAVILLLTTICIISLCLTSQTKQGAGGECKTTNGNPCIFPFKDGNEEYNECKNEGGKYFWCATSVYDSGKYKHWSYCSEDGPCPLEELPTLKNTLSAKSSELINIIQAANDEGVPGNRKNQKSKNVSAEVGSIYPANIHPVGDKKSRTIETDTSLTGNKATSTKNKTPASNKTSLNSSQPSQSINRISQNSNKISLTNNKTSQIINQTSLTRDKISPKSNKISIPNNKNRNNTSLNNNKTSLISNKTSLSIDKHNASPTSSNRIVIFDKADPISNKTSRVVKEKYLIINNTSPIRYETSPMSSSTLPIGIETSPISNKVSPVGNETMSMNNRTSTAKNIAPPRSIKTTAMSDKTSTNTPAPNNERNLTSSENTSISNRISEITDSAPKFNNTTSSTDLTTMQIKMTSSTTTDLRKQNKIIFPAKMYPLPSNQITNKTNTFPSNNRKFIGTVNHTYLYDQITTTTINISTSTAKPYHNNLDKTALNTNAEKIPATLPSNFEESSPAVKNKEINNTKNFVNHSFQHVQTEKKSPAERCQTRTGLYCSFSFIYNGELYHGCGKHGHKYNWCATKVDQHGLYTSWDYCFPGWNCQLK